MWLVASSEAENEGVAVTHDLVLAVRQRLRGDTGHAGGPPAQPVGSGEPSPSPCPPNSVFLSSETCFWHTPDWLLALVRDLFGGTIDLDAASDNVAQQRVQARRYFTAEQDGLRPTCRYHGYVFINPPFGVKGGRSVQGLFLERALREHANNRQVRAIVLVLKASIGYKWLAPAWQHPHCILHERIAFHAAGAAARTANPHGSVVVMLGPSTLVPQFCSLFAGVGNVPGHNSWAARST